MYAESEQEPAVSVVLVKGYSYTLVIIVCKLECFLCLCIFCKLCDDFLAVSTEILFGYLYSYLFGFNRLFKTGNKAVKLLAFAAELCHSYDYLGYKICTVIKEVVFLHGCMSGCFYRKRTIYIIFILLYCFVDNILVASLESEMLSAEIFLDEFFKAA